MDHVGLVLPARRPNLREGRIDSQPRRSQGGNGLNFNQQSLTPQTSLQGRVGRERCLHMTRIDFMILLIRMLVGERHLRLHQVSQ